MNKKGQSEILGLLVIVVLAVVILGIVIAFIIGGTGGESKIQKNLQVSKLGDAILQYTPACPGETTKDMRKIIKDCNFADNTPICGKGCKDLIEEESKNIIQALQGSVQGFDYGLSIKKGSETLQIANCDTIPAIADSTIDPTFTMSLKLCFKS